MINAFQDVQKISQGNLNSAIRMWDEVGRNWQAIAIEMGAYSKRSFEDGAEAVQKLFTPRALSRLLRFSRITRGAPISTIFRS